MMDIQLRSFLVFFLLLASPALGDNARENIGSTRDKLETIEKRMGTAQKKIQKTQKQERSVLGELEAIDRETARVRTRRRELDKQVKQLRKKITESEADIRVIRKRRDQIAKRLSVRSAALYKAGRLSYLKVILSSAGIEDLERRSYYLRTLAESDSELFRSSTELYNREQEQVQGLRSARTRLVSTLRDQEENLGVLVRKKRDKDLVLAAIRDRREKNATLLSELESSASHLKKMLEALQLQVQTGESAFSTLKGSLKKPVSGKVVKSFGRNRTGRFNTYTLSNGITIQSAEGTPIRSVYGGRVIFADWFSGYGRIIILDHGGGYYTLYGHLSELTVDVGKDVKADKVIGLVGDSGSLEGPALYFEIRYHGKPVDPSPWFKG